MEKTDVFIIIVVCFVFVACVTTLLSVRKRKKQPDIVIFKAKWCHHCQLMAPEVNILKQSANVNHVSIAVLDADDDEIEVDKYGVDTFPHVLIYGQSYTGPRTAGSILSCAFQRRHR